MYLFCVRATSCALARHTNDVRLTVLLGCCEQSCRLRPLLQHRLEFREIRCSGFRPFLITRFKTSVPTNWNETTCFVKSAPLPPQKLSNNSQLQSVRSGSVIERADCFAAALCNRTAPVLQSLYSAAVCRHIASQSCTLCVDFEVSLLLTLNTPCTLTVNSNVRDFDVRDFDVRDFDVRDVCISAKLSWESRLYCSSLLGPKIYSFSVKHPPAIGSVQQTNKQTLTWAL